MAAEYQELRKLYYGDKEIYTAEYNKRFDSENAVKLNFHINENRAFFVANAEVAALMFSILRLDKRVAQLCSELPGAALNQYSRKCLIDEIVISNNIEGVHSSRKEIGQVLAQLEEQSENKGNRRRFEGLVNKYMKLTSSEEVSLNVCRDVRTVYDEIVSSEVEAEDKLNAPDGIFFRKEQAVVLSPTGKVIHAAMTPESRIIEAMEEALTFLNDEAVEPLYRIAVFHYLFEYIHPFYDGNGRTGRFILSYCISRNLTPIISYRISETVKENIGDYYKAFTMCSDPKNLGDVTPFLIMMLKMIESAERELEASLEEKLHRWNENKKALSETYGINSGMMFRFYDLLIQATLFSEIGIPAKELQNLLGVSYVTLKDKYLDDARSKGLLIERKTGNTKNYSIDTGEMEGGGKCAMRNA